MTREQTAEWVGYYFGLQRAVNLTHMPENFRTLLLHEMADVELKVGPGVLADWPNVTLSA